MQFIFNQPSSPKRNPRMFDARYFICLGLFLIIGLTNSTVSGQRFRRTRSSDAVHERAPTHFGDTPSPTEMMARLKYHKQQETPLFDLLREAGVDIFSKLSDDEKKLAGRFVEDMILKEGLNSERVSSLMEKMKIGSEAKRALQEGIDRAGGETAISPEQRKELADNVRKDFLQKSELELNDLKTPTNRNWRQPELPPELAAEREALKKRLEELGIESNNPSGSANPNRERELARQRELNRQANRADNRNDRLPLQPEPNRQPHQLAGPEARTTPDLRQPEPSGRDKANQLPNIGPSNNSNPLADSSPTQPNIQALKRLETKLSESQRKIASELNNQIQRGDISPQEIGDLIKDLEKLKSSDDVVGQLDKVGEKFGLPAEDRQELQDAFNKLTPAERGSLKQSFDGIDKELLDQLANAAKERVNRGLDSRDPGSRRPAPSQPNKTATQPDPDLQDLIAESLENFQNEQLGKEFLKDALETYNDANSGYELSPAFKQLKDRAEGIQSNRKLANFGNLSKKLFDESANLFDPKSLSESRRPDGVKPGQRLDQLLAAAADKALAGDSTSGEDKSLFSDTLNNALGAALEKAVDVADKNESNRNRDALQDWTQDDAFNSPNQFDPYEDFNNSQANSSPDSPAYNSPTSSSSNSSNENSMSETAAAIVDSVSELEFNGWTLAYAVGLIALLAGIAFLIPRLLQSGDESVQKQRKLRRKLKTKLAKPKDVVEAVDLFLISRFGTASSWWNAKHAAEQISTNQPDWRDKVASLFQVYQWSRYQADGSANVSSEQNELVNSTLQELNQAPEDAFEATESSKANTASGQSSTANEEATS